MATLAASFKIHEASAKGRFRAPISTLLVLAAAVVPYLASLRYGFVYDDNIQILGTSIIRSWRFVPGYFLKPIPVFITRYYRPLFFVWLRLNYSLWNTGAWGWHLTNVLLHFGACLLVLAVLRRYFSDERAALTGALVFAVHPAHIESVAWISGCTDTLMTIGLLGALLLWMKNCETPSTAFRLGSLVLGALVLLIKETAVILPILISLHAWAEIPPNAKDRPANRLISGLWQAAPYAALTVLLLGWRHFVLRGVSASTDRISLAQTLLTIPSVLLFYVRHLIWPIGLSICYDFQIVTRAASASFWGPLVILVGIGTAIWIWFKRRRDPRVVLASLLFLIPVLPVSYIRFFGSDDFVHDRYLYVSVLGLSILAGQSVELLWRYEHERGRYWLPLALFAALIASLAVSTALQARPWENNLSLFTNAVHIAPRNSLARNGVAGEYIVKGHYNQAAEVLRQLVKDRPEAWIGNYNWGYFNYVTGNLVLADEYLQRAVRINPNDAHQYVVLGETYFNEGRLQDAADELRQGIARRPDAMGYHLVLGLILAKQGNVPAARQELLTEISNHPENTTAQRELRQVDQQVAAAAQAAAR